MKRFPILILTTIAVLFVLAGATAKDKEAPITGNWDCLAKGAPDGDMNFTLYLEQHDENVDGNVYSPMGSTSITSGTFKNSTLEIHIDSERGNYVLLAKYDKGELTGTWGKDDTDKGTWSAKKEASGSH